MQAKSPESAGDFQQIAENNGFAVCTVTQDIRHRFKRIGFRCAMFAVAGADDGELTPAVADGGHF